MTPKAILLFAVLLVGAATPAFAQRDRSASIGTSASEALAASSGPAPWRNIHVVNRSTNNIWCSWTSASPTVAGAGTFPLLGQGATILYAAPGIIPQGPLNCIASGSSSGLTIITVP